MLQGGKAPIGGLTLVALGSNAASDAGDAAATVSAAVDHLRAAFGALSVSPFYRTPAFPAGAGPDFVNAACAFETAQAPQDVLDQLHQIETAFGRTRDLRWGQRTLDLDLIAQGRAVLPDPDTWEHWWRLDPDEQAKVAPDRLILPHPRLSDRSFVLVPLADVAPDWAHPVTGLTVTQMRDARPHDEIASVQPL